MPNQDAAYEVIARNKEIAERGHIGGLAGCAPVLKQSPIKVIISSRSYGYVAIMSTPVKDCIETESTKDAAIVACLKAAGIIEIVDVDDLVRKRMEKVKDEA